MTDLHHDPVALDDAATRARITTDELGATLFVEAGAGTGKTSQLVERIVNLVLHAGVRLADIAAITFTEAAATELADRVRVAFEQRGAATTDEAEARRCAEAVADADLAAITTLHGFARRILAEHAVAAGLPPRIEILDEVSSQLAAEQRWERFVDGLHDDPAHDELLGRAALVGVPLERRYQGQATMKDVAAVLGQSWDRLDRVADAPLRPLAPIDTSSFDTAVAALAALPGECLDPDDRFCTHVKNVLLPAMEPIAAIDDPHRKLAALRAAPSWKTGHGGKKGAWGGDVQAAKSFVHDVNDAVAQVLGAVGDEVLGQLLTLVSREVRAAAEWRRRSGRLEFHDLLVLADRLLRDSDDARRSLHGRYTHLLLDEFQDTDPIQVSLAVAIAAGVGAHHEWEAATIEPGRLFFVGDPKQSIYRFRRADIELFLRARDRFGPDGSWLRLTTNFRSVRPVIDWVNQLFGVLMADEVPGRQPRYQPLVASRDPAPGADHRPVLIGGPHDDARAGELREHEAGDVAGAITAVLTEPQRWPVRDGRTGAWRPARAADIAVLIPTRTSLPYLRRALDDHHVPYRLDTGTLVYDSQEVRDVIAVLRAVDDPTDELSLVAALRSPLYACSDADLFTFRRCGGRWDLRAAPPSDLPRDHPVVGAVAHLRQLWEGRWWTGPSSLLDRVLRERRAFLLAFADERPKEVWRRLRFVLDQARAFEEAHGGGLRDYLAWADLQHAEGAKVHEPLLPETDEAAVRILTVHGAKGLEFPITILSGMTTKPGGNRTGISVVWDGDRPEIKVSGAVRTAHHDPRADLEAEMDADEKRRLLYVACTRARDHLIVACHHKEGDESHAGVVWRSAQAWPERWRNGSDLSPASPGEPGGGTGNPASEACAVAHRHLPPPEDDQAAWIERRRALLDAAGAPVTVAATAIAAIADARPVGASTLSGDGGEAGAPEEEPGSVLVPRRRGRAGTAIGRAVHATLQVVDLDLDGAGDVWPLVQREAARESVPQHAGTVAALVRSALASSAVRLARTAPHHRELYVAAPVAGRVVEGYVDLLVETPDGLVIVDYKTDHVADEAAVAATMARYELQGAAYAVALEAATGQPVAGCRFVFCKRDGAIEVEVADLRRVMEQVRTLITAGHVT